MVFFLLKLLSNQESSKTRRTSMNFNNILKFLIAITFMKSFKNYPQTSVPLFSELNYCGRPIVLVEHSVPWGSLTKNGLQREKRQRVASCWQRLVIRPSGVTDALWQLLFFTMMFNYLILELLLFMTSFLFQFLNLLLKLLIQVKEVQLSLFI